MISSHIYIYTIEGKRSTVPLKYGRAYKDSFFKLNKDGHVCRVIQWPRIEGLVPIHHEILPQREGLMIDHIDGHELNNFDWNLRYATSYQSNKNRGPQGGRGRKGLVWVKRKKKFKVRISADGVLLHIGYFAEESVAIAAYNIYARKFHRDFARLNSIENIPEYERLVAEIRTHPDFIKRLAKNRLKHAAEKVIDVHPSLKVADLEIDITLDEAKCQFEKFLAKTWYAA